MDAAVQYLHGSGILTGSTGGESFDDVVDLLVLFAGGKSESSSS
jgi:hypothetical protein